MRAVIADDEELVRYSVSDMLSELTIPVSIAGEAENGTELIRLCLELQPDVAFVDVRMPGVDGLQAIEVLRSECPNTDWIVLTSYSEFEYARRAIGAGVAEYLLKPVGSDELEGVVRRLFERHRTRLSEENERFENAVRASLRGVDRNDTIRSWTEWRFSLSLLVADPTPGSPNRDELTEEASVEVRRAFADLLAVSVRFAVVTVEDEALAAIIAVDSRGGEPGTVQSVGERGRNRLVGVCRHLREAGRLLTLAYSEELVSGADLRSRIAALRRAAPARLLSGVGKPVELGRLDRLRALPGADRLVQSLIAGGEAWRDRRPLAFEQSVLGAASLLAENRSLRSPELVAGLNGYLSAVISPRAVSIASTTGWLPELREELIRRQPAEEGDRSGGALIREVVAYLEENYTRNIGIAEVAGVLGLTPNYLSSLFHRRVGSTFTQYLTRLRMERARDLLASSGCTVGEAAAAVGYASTRHFARVFLKTFDSYPSEIKRQRS